MAERRLCDARPELAGEKRGCLGGDGACALATGAAHALQRYLQALRYKRYTAQLQEVPLP